MVKKSKIVEQQRENKGYYEYENMLCNANIRLSKFKFFENDLKSSLKELNHLFSLMVDGKPIINNETLISLKVGTEIAHQMKLIDLRNFIISKIKEKGESNYLKITNLKIVSNANPFDCTLTKSLGITALTADFLIENELLGVDTYNALEKGFIEEATDYWNVDIEKAVKNLAKYKAVRKLVYRNGKTFVVTYYVNPITQLPEEQDSIELNDDKNIHAIAISGLAVGDEIEDKNGAKAVVRRFEKDGSIRLDYGSGIKTTMSFSNFAKKVKNGDLIISAHKNVQIKNTNATPTSLADLTHISSLGGSTGAELTEDENGVKWVVKRGGGKQASEQCANEALANQIYETLGLNAPKSTIITDKGDKVLVSGFVENLQDINSISGTAQFTNTKVLLQSTFVAHALLGNLDIVENDNTKVDVNGNIFFLDNGGSLLYRAQGGPKNFDKSCSELSSMLSFTSNQTKWFGNLTKGDIAMQIENLILPKKDEVLKTISNASYLDKAQQKELLDTMTGRFDSLEKFLDNYKLNTKNKNSPIKYDDAKDTLDSITLANSKKNDYKVIDDYEKILDDVNDYIKNKNGGKSKNDTIGFVNANFMCKARGFDGKPTILSDVDFNKLFIKSKSQKGANLLYRTVGAGHEDSLVDRTEFYTGGVGQSAYGAGLYFANETNSLNNFTTPPPPPRTNDLSDSQGYGDLTHVVMTAPNFKWGDLDSIRSEMRNFLNNTIVNPKFDKAKDAFDKATQALKDHTKNFHINFAKTRNHAQEVAVKAMEIHAKRDWGEHHVTELADILNKFGNGASGKQIGQTIRLQLPKNADGSKGEHYDYVLTGAGNTNGKSYNTNVKTLFNKIYDEYSVPFQAELTKADMHSDKQFIQLSSDAMEAQDELNKHPHTIPNPNLTKSDKALMELIKKDQSGDSAGIYAIHKGYDGVTTSAGNYRVIYNRTKLIINEKLF